MILIETTEWSAPNIPNHVYIANQSKDKIEGYFNVVKQNLVWFSKPQRFDRRYRTFKTFDFIITKEDNMTDFAFTAVMNAINNLPKNTNFNKILKDEYGVTKEYTKNEAKFICQYLLQGSAKGLEGDELMKYAVKSQRDLFDRFPHLQEDIVMENTATETVQVKTVKTGAKATKTAAKTAKTKKAAKLGHAVAEAVVTNTRVVSTRKITSKTVKPRYEDYSIVWCEKRQGYNGFVNNKAEAFRNTVEKVQAFFQKKYGVSGNVIA